MHTFSLDRTDFLNTATHAVGFLLSIIGLPILVHAALDRGGKAHLISSVVFGVCMVAMFATSTIYHASAPSKIRCVRRRYRRRFRMADHIAIYLMIAGSYTPYCVTVLKHTVGWPLLTALWAMVAFGAVYKLFFLGRFPRVSLVLYLCMGCTSIFVMGPLLEKLPPISFHLLMAGGTAFLIGTGFFVYESRRPSYHVVWHIFVLIGSACLYGSILGGIPA